MNILDTNQIAFAIVWAVGMLTAATILAVLVLLWRAWQASAQLLYPVHRAAICTPEDYGLACEKLIFRSPDGPELRGWWIPTTLPAKGTIVINHGYTGDCSPDLVYAPLFNNAGYHVCLFDYRGHGASDGDYTSLVFYERRDLLAALDVLRTRGIDRVGLLGFSMGGAIALATAPCSPSVVGVISDCAFGELSAVIANAARRRGIPLLLAQPIGWLVVFLASLRVRANLSEADPLRWVGKISPRPILIMHGKDDADVPVDQAYRLYCAAQEPKELWVVPGAKHRMIEEVAGEEYHRRVLEFFERAFANVPSAFEKV